MIAMMIIAIAMAVTSISLTLQTQMVETAQAYRQEVQISALSRFYVPMRNRADKLGLWPETKSELDSMAKILRDPALESVIEDNPSNPYYRYIGYARSDQEKSDFKVKRSVLYFVDPDILGHDEEAGGFLDEKRNPCGGDYSDEDPWCPPVIADADYTLYRSDADKRQRSLMLAQEARLKRFGQRVGNFMSYQDAKHPDTSAVSTDAQPLYELLTTDVEGTNRADLSPGNNSCDGSKVYYWDGIPLTCRDIFSVWHVDTKKIYGDTDVKDGYENGLISQNPSENPELPSNSNELKNRLHSPVYVFDDGTTFLLYATTPYNRNGENNPAYVYMDLSL